MPPKKTLPQLGKKADTYSEQATVTLDEINQILAMDTNCKVTIGSIIPLLEASKAYIHKSREQPSNKEVIDQITIIKSMVQNTQPPGASAKTWANIAATPITSTHRTPERAKQVTVKITDPVSIGVLRSTSEKDLKQRITTAILSNPATSHLSKDIAAVRQLKSGDITIYTSTETGAKSLTEDTNGWESALGTNSKIIHRTYGVMVHGVPTRGTDIGNQAQLIEQILQENSYAIREAKIRYTGWLSLKAARAKEYTTLIIEFSTPEAANQALDGGLVLNSRMHQCELYDRACRIKQCFNCHKYGHIGSQCRAKTACGYCAGAHATKECPSRGNLPLGPPRCPCCRGEHAAWSDKCPERQKELTRVQIAKLHRARRFTVPASAPDVARTLTTPSPQSSQTMAQSTTTPAKDRQSAQMGTTRIITRTRKPSRKVLGDLGNRITPGPRASTLGRKTNTATRDRLLQSMVDSSQQENTPELETEMNTRDD
jgi:hypothetical protein